MKISLNKISKQDTLFLKGIAIAGMLMWHIFYCPNPEGITYSPIIQYIGTIGDVCVSIFLFISGYIFTLSYISFIVLGDKKRTMGYDFYL